MISHLSEQSEPNSKTSVCNLHCDGFDSDHIVTIRNCEIFGLVPRQAGAARSEGGLKPYLKADRWSVAPVMVKSTRASGDETSRTPHGPGSPSFSLLQ